MFLDKTRQMRYTMCRKTEPRRFRRKDTASRCRHGFMEFSDKHIMTELDASPVIAAVRTPVALRRACKTDIGIVFILHAALSDAAAQVQIAKDAGKCVFIHADLVEGLSADAAAVQYLRCATAADGIISTRSAVIRAAKDCGFLTVQRFFVVDSQAEEALLRTVSQTHPDCIELMPGILPTVIARLRGKLSQPVISGGLVETKEQVISLLSAGAHGISTSKEALWTL